MANTPHMFQLPGCVSAPPSKAGSYKDSSDTVEYKKEMYDRAMHAQGKKTYSAPKVESGMRPGHMPVGKGKLNPPQRYGR
jgi:hypothetical protein